LKIVGLRPVVADVPESARQALKRTTVLRQGLQCGFAELGSGTINVKDINRYFPRSECAWRFLPEENESIQTVNSGAARNIQKMYWPQRVA